MHPFFRSVLALLLIGTIVLPFASFARSSTTTTTTPTQAELAQKYADAATSGKKVRILIMPGHEPDFGGAVYKDVYERDITVLIADQLAAYLKQDSHIEPIVARSSTGWNDDLQNYFDKDWKDIQKFVKSKKKDMAKQIKKGSVTVRDADDQVDHATAPTDSALRLYGINKWADENSIDFIVHIHINDTTDHGPNEPSLNSGYAVYVPDAQFKNADTSYGLGEAIANELARMNATSTLSIENKGVVEDQQLIAIGANGTLTAPSALVEYAYITEPKLTQTEVRSAVTRDYALETYKGILDFLGAPVTSKYISASLPATFVSITTPAIGSSTPEVYSLQAGLHTLGFYPAPPSTLVDCPISGMMSPCVTNALKAFQASKGIVQTGTLGLQTRTMLNAELSDKPVVVEFPVAATTTTTNVRTGTCSFMHALTIGSTDATTGGEVTVLQKTLGSAVTGYYGPATQAALQAFQVKNGVAVKGGLGYGLLGPKTKTAVLAVCK